MSLTYATWVSQVSALTVISSGDSNLATVLPGCIDYAEQRMYRELDLLATRVSDATSFFTTGSRDFTLPTATGTFLVVERLSAITPVGATSSYGSRSPIYQASPDFIDASFPGSTSYVGVPEFFAMVSNTQLIVGPVPDSSYAVEVWGTQRPTPLSASNSSTILTQMLPDAFFAASMIYMFGYMRDFGGQADTAQGSISWEGQYNKLMASANVEELRKKYQSQAWTSQQPNQVATPPRA